MTTAAQVKAVVAPLLAHHSDVALIGRTLFLKPVRHLLRGLLVDRSRGSTLFVPHRAVIHLFSAKQSFSLSWGKEIYPRSAPLWDVDNPSTAVDMREMIEADALPLLRRIETLDDFVAYTRNYDISQNSIDQHPLEHVIVEIARGDLDAARSICVSLSSPRLREWYMLLDRDGYLRLMTVLRPLIEAGDRTGLARLLHEWEAITIKNLKLEKYWEKTPFPLEQSSI